MLVKPAVLLGLGERQVRRIYGVGAVLAGIFLLGLYCIDWSLRRRIRRKWGIPSPRCAYGTYNGVT